MDKRKNTPRETETQILFNSCRRCCLCFGLEGDFSQKSGQIAHIDKNPLNASLNNLVFLCLEHHDQYDSKTSQSKGLTIYEVKKYRNLLHDAVQELRDNKKKKREIISGRSKDQAGYLLMGVKTGTELVDIAIDAHFYSFTNDEPKNADESKLIGDFLTEVVDCCEDLGSLGIKAKIDLGMYFSDEIKKLESNGFKVFGKRVHKKLNKSDITLWTYAYLSVIRSSNPNIINLDKKIM